MINTPFQDKLVKAGILYMNIEQVTDLVIDLQSKLQEAEAENAVFCSELKQSNEVIAEQKALLEDIERISVKYHLYGVDTGHEQIIGLICKATKSTMNVVNMKADDKLTQFENGGHTIDALTGDRES